MLLRVLPRVRRGRVHTQRYNVAVAASIQEFSYQLTAEANREQERAVAALQTRAGTVLAAASVSGSFLGTKVSHGSLDVWAVLALIAFVLCVGAAIYVLLPHKLVFAFRGQALLRRAITRASTMSPRPTAPRGSGSSRCWSRTATRWPIFQTGSASAACF
jgi:hypothetical protein